MNTIQSRIQHKRDTSSNWEQNNPIILAGEIIIVDTNSGERRTKTGDGIKRYNELPFDDELIRNLVSSKDAETLQSAKQYTDEKIGDVDLANVVTAIGGGSIQPNESIGVGPFVITMDEDNDAELSASVVGYSNSSSGLTSNNVQSAIDEVSENVNGKIAKVSGASTGHLPTFSSDGELQDSGKSINEIGSSNLIKVTLSTSSWTDNDDGRYKQTVNVIGVTTTTKVIVVDCDLSTSDVDAKVEILTAWQGPSANEATQGDGTLTFYSYEIPSINIPINVGVM